MFYLISRFQIIEHPDGRNILKISIIDQSDDGTWKIVASNENGQAESSSKISVGRRSISGRKPVFKKSLKDIIQMESPELKLEVQVQSTPTPEISWWFLIHKFNFLEK